MDTGVNRPCVGVHNNSNRSFVGFFPIVYAKMGASDKSPLLLGWA